MIGALDRIRAVRLIKETVDDGARTASACKEIGISLRTFQRWTQEGEVKADGRPDADRPPPDTKLCSQERQAGVGHAQQSCLPKLTTEPGGACAGR